MKRTAMVALAAAHLVTANLVTGCSTSHSAKLVAPKGAEYVTSGEERPDSARLVAKMDEVGDYTLDGDAPRPKKKSRAPRHPSSF
jgi:hypothetical protein